MLVAIAVLIVNGLMPAMGLVQFQHFGGDRLISTNAASRLTSKRLYMTDPSNATLDLPSTAAVADNTDSKAADVSAPRTYTPREGGTGGVVSQGNGPRTYTPRATPADAPREPRVYQGSGSKVYKPRVDPSKPATTSSTSTFPPRPSYGQPTSYGGSSANFRDQAMSLSNPQLLIRFRAPRIKSDFKIQLEGLQETFREQSDASRGSSYGGGSGGGGRSFSDNRGSDSFDAIFAQTSGKKGAIDRKKGSDEEGDGGRKARGATSRRSNVVGEDEEFTDDDSGEEVVDYGDEVNRGLSSVSAGDLQRMEQDGYSLEEMQMTLYGEYGIKSSQSAIRRKLQEDKKERKGKVRTGKTRRDRNLKRNARFAPADRGIVLPETSLIQIIELARLMEVGGGEVVKHLMINKGIMASMTQSIEISIARAVVIEFGKKLAGDDDEEYDDEEDDEDDEALEELTADGKLVERVSRPPVVTIMGHVDHGKTTLLDSIRKTQVAKGEAGGITQGISAFKVQTSDERGFVTFIDTPGHAAFSEMRKRGANVTDIVILVVAADDGIMEQTKECIAAAKAAACPIVVVINKIDKEGADPQKILTSLMSYDILTEEFGGQVQCAKVSAKSGLGIEELLEKVLLQAEVMNLRAPIDTPAMGTVIEARVDKGLGVVVTALVQKGSLKIGDYVLAGNSWGKVRRLVSDQKKELKEAGPSTPVQIVGMSVVPNAGDVFTVTTNEAAAREVAEARQRLSRQAAGTMSAAAIKANSQGFMDGTQDTRDVIKVPLLIKGDVSGSVEALRQSIDALTMSDDEAICKADIVFSGVGDVSSSDVAVAAASRAKILAFNVASGFNAMEEARASNVEIGYYNVVYDLLDELAAIIKTTLAPPPPGTLIGRAEIKKVFKLGKVGKVAGCLVTEGMLKSDSQVRIMRGKRNPIYTGTLSSLKVVKEVTAEVPNGSECGMSFTDYQDFEEGDVVECFVGGDQDKEDFST